MPPVSVVADVVATEPTTDASMEEVMEMEYDNMLVMEEFDWENPTFCDANGETLEWDEKLQNLALADHQLMTVYSDSIHQIDRRHLSGGVEGDTFWKSCNFAVVNDLLPLYDLPEKGIVNAFILMLVHKFEGVPLQKWNSDHPLCFPSIILRCQPGVHKAGYVKCLI